MIMYMKKSHSVITMSHSMQVGKAWAVFNHTCKGSITQGREAGEGDLPYEEEAMCAHAKEMMFPIGAPNDGFAQYFSGRSFLAPISTSQVGIFNVTFEPGCSKLV